MSHNYHATTPPASMDSDPWKWSVADVQQFFRDRAADYISDMPHGRLPPLNEFLGALRENDIDGANLLDTIDTRTLKEDCGVASLGVRGAVLHCIVRLRRESVTYSAQRNGPVANNPSSAPILPQLATPPSAEFLVTEPVAEPFRLGEVQIDDERRRKRRKLLEWSKPDPPKESPVKEQTDQVSPVLNPIINALGYLPDEGHTIDELFFGETEFGKEVKELQPAGDVRVTKAHKDAADDNFEFTYQHKGLGDSMFVYRRMLRFLKGPEIVDITRHGRAALAVLPYQETEQHKTRSAYVLQFPRDTQEPIAFRENATHLQEGYDANEPIEETTGEWDYLVKKYNHDADKNAVLPLYGESDFDSDEDEAFNSTVGSDQEDEALEVKEDSYLTPETAATVIDSAVQDFISRWHAVQLPKLEKEKAWSVWKKTKQSRTIRDSLIEGAQSWAEHLDARLINMKAEILKDRTWKHESSLTEACAILEPTVEQCEEQKWKISVWKRRQEPAHVVRHGTQKHSVLQTPASEKREAGFVVHPDDRLSVSPRTVSPAPGSPVPVENAEEAPYEADDEDFHTPANSPTPSPDTGIGAFIEPDEAVVEHDLTNGATGEETDDIFGSQDAEIANVEQDTDADKSSGPSAPLGDVEKSDRNKDGDFTAHEHDSESDELPSASKFVSRRKRPSSPIQTPSKKSTIVVDLTGISSDSTPPTNRKRRPMAPPATMRGNPLDATSSDVDSWDLTHLVRTADRMRILIKLLREAGPKMCDRIRSCYKQLGRAAFTDQLLAAFHAHRQDSTEGTGLTKYLDTMLLVAKIYARWAIPTALEEGLDKEVWKAVASLEQTGQFSTMLMNVLQKKDSKLLKDQIPTPPQPSSSNHPPSTNPIPISSSDEARTPTKSTPHKKRKRLVGRSMAARDAREAAFDRQTRFQESQHASNSHHLAAMIASDSNESTVVINPMNENENFIYIAQRIAKDMKGHQLDGARFLWREITADGDEDSQGCILAHTMGLGKTMQTIACLVAVNEAAQSEERGIRHQLPPQLRPKGIIGVRNLRMLILCPPALIQNWEREMKHWAPGQLGTIYSLESSSKATHMRSLREWTRFGGVVLLGYQMFRAMIIRKSRKVELKNGRSDEDAVKIEKMLLDGTEIVVADEAHNLKGIKTDVAIAASRFKTESRIGLTGTPMSNDVDEIYSLVSWVAPGYLGEADEFRAHYAEPIKEGLFADSTAYERRKSIKKLAVLHAEIKPKVDRATIEVLRGSIKAKTEFVITVPLGEVQTELYKRYIKALNSGTGDDKISQVRIFGWLAVLTLLTNHPVAFRQKLLEPPRTKAGPKRRRTGDGTDLDDDSRDISPNTESGAGTPSHAGAITALEELMDVDITKLDSGEEPAEEKGLSSDTVQAILSGWEPTTDPTLSAKVNIFLKLLELSLKCGDKVLVFTTSIPTLDYLDKLLRQYELGFGRIDGHTKTENRIPVLEDFHNGKFDIMLVSTKAGGVGLNIQGANRVFIFDFGFNPTYEEQAVGRAYRLGQTKPVFVYRFVAGGTFETNIYNKQLFKTSLAQRVVDKKNPRRNAERNTREYLYEPHHVRQEDIHEWMGKDHHVLDRLLSQHGPEYDTGIRAIKTMETLQEDAEDAPLDEEERKEVDQEIEQSRQRPRGRRAAAIAIPSPPPPATAPQPQLIARLPVNGAGNPRAPASTAVVSGNNDSPQPRYMGGLPLPRIQ